MDSFTTGPLSLLTMSVKQNTQVRRTPRRRLSAEPPAAPALDMALWPHAPPPARLSASCATVVRHEIPSGLHARARLAGRLR